jgi:hypothetical protein
LARWLYQQQLIETDAEMAIGQRPDLIRCELNWVGDCINYSEVVPQPMHLCEK